MTPAAKDTKPKATPATPPESPPAATEPPVPPVEAPPTPPAAEEPPEPVTGGEVVEEYGWQVGNDPVPLDSDLAIEHDFHVNNVTPDPTGEDEDDGEGEEDLPDDLAGDDDDDEADHDGDLDIDKEG